MNTSSKAAYSVIIASTIILCSCSVFGPSDSKKESGVNSEQRAKTFLEQYQWKLIQINGELPPNASSAHLNFRFDQGKFQGNAGCNQLFGNVQLNGDSIQFSNIASTEMACETPLMALEKAFISLLNKGSFHFDIADQTLNLYDRDRLVLMFGLQRE